ncbi:E3 ubiquitin-protein ligase MIB1 [Schistosoma japonicum]|uniref:E3 ubiquitin-protein ligase MIB1 n=2 Tax=Schistosoma japonicum TaxID=6182 RepID=A0A4Z2DCN1_SCHJA|nr:E3 ubiquitin-protein ligase MIB1 [Schistosoma japonicum]
MPEMHCDRLPLHLAVSRQDIPMVQCLLEEMNALTNLQDCDGDTPLHDAISSQNITLVKLLLRHNPDLTILNNAGQNSLHCATVFGETEIIRLLLEHCSSTPWIVDESQPDGLTALHLASLNGNMEAVDLLLQAGASPNLVVRRPAGLSPLSGCDEAKLGSVFTPLHLAVHKAHPDVVCLLLCYRARAACRSGAGRSPMQLALNALSQVHDSQGTNIRRFDVALVPFLASVARLLVRMADSLTLTPASAGTLSGGINKLRLHSNRNNYEEQLIEIDNDPEDEPHRSASSELPVLMSPSALCRRLKSTIQATLETGVPRNVLIAACLASAIGAESWSSHIGAINSECAEEDDVDNVNTESVSENFVTDVFRECRDPVLQLALQQCHMEALNFVKCYPLNSDSINRSPRHEINRPDSPLLATICDSDEENLIDTFFQTDNRQVPPNDLLPSCSAVGSNNSYMIQSPLINQTTENSLSQPFAIENQLIPEPNNLHRNIPPPSVYTLLPPTLDDIDLEWRECLVCSERNRSTIIVPCGHIITCETCTPLIKKCLLCRQRITGYHKFSSCCECNHANGVVLSKPCNHMLWCKSCLKSKVQQLEIIQQITGNISFEEEEDEVDDRNQTSSINNASVTNTDLLNVSLSISSATPNTAVTSGTQSSRNLNIDELDPLFSTETSSSSVNRTNDINLWNNVPLGRLLAMINKLQSLLDDLLTGGICLDGCPTCGNTVSSLCPVLVACSGVNNQSTSIALAQDRHDSNPFTLNSCSSIETELNPTNSNITNILPTNNPVLANVQTDMELVQNQLVSSNPSHNLSPVEHQTYSGLVSTSTRQTLITPNNQLHQNTSQAEVSGRSRGPRTHLCERELTRLKHELQVMREQIRCPICLDRSRNLVFMCGHATCQWCGDQVTACPICRRAVESRIILY